MVYNHPIFDYGHSKSIDPVASFPLARQFFAMDSGPDVLVGMVASHHRLNRKTHSIFDTCLKCELDGGVAI